jgi:hypothetical protein
MNRLPMSVAQDQQAAGRVNPQTGLTLAEVDALRRKHGYNEVAEKKGHPVLMVLGKFWGVSAWMLELIMILSAVLRKYSDVAVVGAQMISCLVVNDAVKVAMIRWRVPAAGARNAPGTFIVMGSRGLGMIKGLFLGSVSDAIVRCAETPVLLVPSARPTQDEPSVATPSQ